MFYFWRSESDGNSSKHLTHSTTFRPNEPISSPWLVVFATTRSLQDMDPSSATVLKGDTASDVDQNAQLARILAATNRNHVGHIGRRVFIGPMPEKVISHIEQGIKRKKADTGAITLSQLETAQPEESEDIVQVVKQHARRFIAHYKSQRPGDNVSMQSRDSDEDDWDEDRERHITDEIIQKWKESEWGQAWSNRRRRKNEPRQPASHWVGGSFEIGSLLGVNILHGGHSKPYMTMHKGASASTMKIPNIVLSRAEHPRDLRPPPIESTASISSAPGRAHGSGVDSIADSRTGLLSSSANGANTEASGSQGPLSPLSSARQGSSDTHLSAKAEGKRRQVHYGDEIKDDSEVPITQSATSVVPPPPVPPIEVLERTEVTVEPTTSQGAMLTPLTPGFEWGDVILRDRMLVRIAYSKSNGLSPKFDDSTHRTTRDLQHEDWGEFLVAWRKDLIEIYEDHKVPGREFLTGTKHLAFVIPLKSSRTSLSLYSFVDLTFCITCPPMSTRLNSNSRWIFSRSKPGTNIFIFKHKSRSRSWDWIWQLWRYRGGEIPPSIDVYNPRLNTRVTVDVPFRREIDHQELYDILSRENVIALCMKSLRSVPDWFSLVEREITQEGKRLELCWRRDASLDWMWLEVDVFGKSRPWATIAGLAVLQSSRPPNFEIRLTSHAPTHYHLKNGSEIEEPPSVEGYVERIKPNTQFKQSLYLSTHNGLLFIQHVDNAYPPAPPGLALTLQDLDSWITGLRQSEVERGSNQVLHASGVCDLRSIVAVRRAFQPVPPIRHDQKDRPAGDDASWLDVWSQPETSTLDDDEDEGGEAYLNTVRDRTMVRVRRSFELLLETGNVIRFETHSRKVAVEWINRLRALITFWKHKHRVDAKEEMELVQARRPRLTPQIRVCQEEESPPEAPADMSAPYPAMENLYNWCIIEGCNPITKGGKVYMRKGLRGQYKLVQVLLVAGHLVRFRIKPGSSLHTVSHKKINLMDAYVYSGYFAALNLPKGQYRPNKPAAPRRYQDGLETDDREEDMLLMIHYRRQPSVNDAEHAPTNAPTSSRNIPTLSTKQKVLVLRTRSRIERDAWCWALNTEIEKIARTQCEREAKLMETGKLIELNK